MQPNHEHEDGLIHYQHRAASPNPFDPDAHAVVADEDLIEEAASESHHGLIRGPLNLRESWAAKKKPSWRWSTRKFRPTAWLLTIAFVFTIFSIPLAQSFLEISNNLGERRSEAANGGPVITAVVPSAFDALQELPSSEQIGAVRNWNDAWSLLPDADNLKSHEESLEDESFISRWMLPRAQGVLLRAGVGNEQVYLGNRDASGNQWLFYRPDVDYLSSKGFLDPALQTMRARAGDDTKAAVQPNPLKAILQFQGDLAARNIQLVIMPIPVKPMIEVEHLLARNGSELAQLQNPSYSQLLQSLTQKGVLVFDPTPILQERKQLQQKPQFLQTDTHWTPDAMQHVAAQLAEFLQQNVRLQQAQSEYSVKPKQIQNIGDTAGMLSLLKDQKYFPRQQVTINQIYNAQNQLWRSDKSAQVLLLGDSFFNIYSQPGLGWGEGAGFGSQLSRFLQQPVDAVVINAGGSHTSRQRLVGEMKRDPNRLRGKKIVVWEFSMRDLLIGDWKVLPLPK